MSAIEKFKEQNSLFSDSSGIEITQQGKSLLEVSEDECEKVYYECLVMYYEKYSIDIFDDDCIEKIISLNAVGETLGYDAERVAEDLREVQAESKDDIYDFLSYQKCLKAYYKKHGAETEFLAEIFCDRYRLQEFYDITVEDVLEDLYKIMETKPVLANFYEKLEGNGCDTIN